ncbi:hypothetical protein DF3PA_70036 [Candidatus Defluviicoccus seviourii]|uniref:Uncharacterized protein n=1 Tax=Candidatus Defluviicoccus seviourii TaxID=2565273 RepID=A0A564WGW8_9PROT|nr:hypothetical protein DF3PA_70036 [Candidatus Defluviicoccus seviourii]
MNADKNSAAGRQTRARPADNGWLAPAMTLPYSALNLKDSFTVTHQDRGAVDFERPVGSDVRCHLMHGAPRLGPALASLLAAIPTQREGIGAARQACHANRFGKVKRLADAEVLGKGRCRQQDQTFGWQQSLISAKRLRSMRPSFWSATARRV